MEKLSPLPSLTKALHVQTVIRICAGSVVTTTAMLIAILSPFLRGHINMGTTWSLLAAIAVLFTIYFLGSDNLEKYGIFGYLVCVPLATAIAFGMCFIATLFINVLGFTVAVDSVLAFYGLMSLITLLFTKR